MKPIIESAYSRQNNWESMSAQQRSRSTTLHTADPWNFVADLKTAYGKAYSEMIEAVRRMDFMFLPAGRWTFRSKPGEINFTYLTLSSAIWAYLETKSVPAKEVPGLDHNSKNLIQNLVQELGLDIDSVMVYYGGYDDFQKYFLDSDFLKSANNFCPFAESITDYISQPMLQGLHFNFDPNAWVPDEVYLYDKNGEVTDYTISKDELIDFLETPSYSFAWSFLRWTHSIVEISPNLTLLVGQKIVGFDSLIRLADVLSVIEPIPQLAKSIEEERQTIISMSKYLGYWLDTNLKQIISSSISELSKDLMIEIATLTEETKNYIPNETKEFHNVYTW